MSNKHLIALLLTAGMLSWADSLQAQIHDRIRNAARNRAEDRVVRRVENSVDEAADNLEAKKKKEISAAGEANTGTTAASGEKQQESKSPGRVNDKRKFEFVPGNELLYAEDFAGDAIDELPYLWATDLRGVVVEPEGLPGKWLRLSHSGQVIAPLFPSVLPDNFTVEFDLMLDFKADGYVYPDIMFRLLESLQGDKDGRKYVSPGGGFRSTISCLDFTLLPGEDAPTGILFQSMLNGVQYFAKDNTRFSPLPTHGSRVVKVSIWVQKQRLRMWMDKEKVYDLQQAVPIGIKLNRMAFQVSTTIQPDEEIGVYVSNFRIATAGADTRSKLITEGKFTTNGILFDTNSDKIKPLSASVLADVAEVLQQHPEVRIRIIGHTDADGTDTHNLTLSKKRALAVKNALSKDYNISPDRMETDGRGAQLPVADNKTPEGKAKNRRVEFVKL
jgi:OOP family OmpA-OmpF porin